MKKSKRWLIVILMALFMSAITISADICRRILKPCRCRQRELRMKKGRRLTFRMSLLKSCRGKERIVLTFSKESGAMIESKNSHSVVAIMANTYIPEDFRRTLGEGKLD